MKKIICLSFLLSISAPCFAQDALIPASDAVGDTQAADSSNAPETTVESPKQLSLSDKLVAMTDHFVEVIASHEGNCDAMKADLKQLIATNKTFMASLEFATENADESAMARVHENAQKLGTMLGKCYADKEIDEILSNQVAE